MLDKLEQIEARYEELTHELVFAGVARQSFGLRQSSKATSHPRRGSAEVSVRGKR